MPMPQKHEAALFALALEKPADLRHGFLDAVCAGDPALRQRLDALLAAHERPEPRLAMQAEPVKTIKLKPAEAPDETAEQTLGRYKLLKQVRGVSIL